MNETPTETVRSPRIEAYHLRKLQDALNDRETVLDGKTGAPIAKPRGKNKSNVISLGGRKKSSRGKGSAR